MTGPVEIRLHAIEWDSKSNGPGNRLTLWTQGCSLGCPGCFNPLTHPFHAGQLWSVDHLIEQIITHRPAPDGLTISGGEPFQQPRALLALAKGIRQATGLSILVFSGYTLDEINAIHLGPSILQSIDALISGRYQSKLASKTNFLTSSNQNLYLFSSRFLRSDFEQLPEADVWISPSGEIRLSGTAPFVWRGEVG